MLERFKQNIVEKKLFAPSDRLLLAVSGGVDSVVLCDLCSRAGFKYEIAHVNFRLRGEESAGDERFVKGMATCYRVPFHVKQFDTGAFAEENKVSVQVAARDLRYAWFNELLTQGELQYLLTAHHADDNVETVLFNFFRGTGITGLRGMLHKNDRVVRPLLPFTKTEILNFAKENKLGWREDSSNASDKYSRNYFRNAVIPMVNKIFPEAEGNLLHNIERFTEVEALYRQSVELHKKKLVERRGNEVHIPVLKLKKAVPLRTILFEIVSEFHFTAHQLNDLVHLLDAGQGKFVQSHTHRIFINRGWLIISPLDTEQAENILIEEDVAKIIFSNGALEINTHPTGEFAFSKAADIAELDYRKITFPLNLRKWKAGDYFYPLGMKKKKKVARFLIDQKLSLSQKNKVWILESGKKICWIVGMRIDERFKILPSTKQVLKIKSSQLAK